MAFCAIVYKASDVVFLFKTICQYRFEFLDGRFKLENQIKLSN